jgi:hypothetical protein
MNKSINLGYFFLSSAVAALATGTVPAYVGTIENKALISIGQFAGRSSKDHWRPQKKEVMRFKPQLRYRRNLWLTNMRVECPMMLRGVTLEVCS